VVESAGCHGVGPPGAAVPGWRPVRSHQPPSQGV